MNADVIIIGGGIAGCSAAFHLAESGVSTLLLDRGEISGEASGVNMGGLGASGWGNSPGLQEYLTMGSLNIFKKLMKQPVIFDGRNLYNTYPNNAANKPLLNPKFLSNNPDS